MLFGLTETQQTLKNTVRKFLAAECPLAEVRRMMETETAFDSALWTKMAEQGVAPLRNELLDLDFDQLMLGDMKTSLAGVNWLHADNVVLSKDATPEGETKLVTDAAQPYTLMLYSNYHLTSDFHALIVRVMAVLLPKVSHGTSDNGERLSVLNIKNALVVQTVVYRKNIPDDTLDAVPLPPKPPVQKGPDGRPLPSDQVELDDDQQQAAILWGKDHGQMIKDALTEAATITSRLVAQSLIATPVPAADALAAKVDGYGHGQVLEQGAGRDVVLLNDHSLISSDAADVETSPAGH